MLVFVASVLAMLTLSGCAGFSGRTQGGLASWLDMMGLHRASARHAEPRFKPVHIGPYSRFSGRLIVMEPARRWQVSLMWRAIRPEQGWLRITHAATATVVELRWDVHGMTIHDNKHPLWRNIGMNELSAQGIVIPPQQLAAILLGKMPAQFKFTGKRTGQQSWKSQQSGRIIKLRWQPEVRKLSITDMKHGRQAILVIQS